MLNGVLRQNDQEFNNPVAASNSNGSGLNQALITVEAVQSDDSNSEQFDLWKAEIDKSWSYAKDKTFGHLSILIEPLFSFYLYGSILPASQTFVGMAYDNPAAGNAVGYPMASVLSSLNCLSDLFLFLAVEEAKSGNSPELSEFLKKLNALLKEEKITEEQKKKAITFAYVNQILAAGLGWSVGASADAIAIALLVDNIAAQVILGLAVTVLGIYYYKLSMDQRIEAHTLGLFFDFKEGWNVLCKNPAKGIEFLCRVGTNMTSRGISFGYILHQLAVVNMKVSANSPHLASAVLFTVVANAYFTGITRTIPSYQAMLGNAEERKDEIFMLKMLLQDNKLTDAEKERLKVIATAMTGEMKAQTVKLQALVNSNDSLLDNNNEDLASEMALLQSVITMKPLAESKARILLSLSANKFLQCNLASDDDLEGAMPVIDEEIRNTVKEQGKERLKQQQLLNQLHTKIVLDIEQKNERIKGAYQLLSDQQNKLKAVPLSLAQFLYQMSLKQKSTLTPIQSRRFGEIYTSMQQTNNLPKNQAERAKEIVEQIDTVAAELKEQVMSMVDADLSFLLRLAGREIEQLEKQASQLKHVASNMIPANDSNANNNNKKNKDKKFDREALKKSTVITTTNRAVDAVMSLTRAVPLGYLLQISVAESMGNYAYALSLLVGATTFTHSFYARSQIRDDHKMMDAIDEQLKLPELKVTKNGDVLTAFNARVQQLEDKRSLQAAALLISGGGRLARWFAFYYFIEKLGVLFHEQNWTPALAVTTVLALNVLLATLTAEADAPMFDEANRKTIAQHITRAEYVLAAAPKEVSGWERVLVNKTAFTDFFYRTNKELAGKAQRVADQDNVDRLSGSYSNPTVNPLQDRLNSNVSEVSDVSNGSNVSKLGDVRLYRGLLKDSDASNNVAEIKANNVKVVENNNNRSCSV